MYVIHCGYYLTESKYRVALSICAFIAVVATQNIEQQLESEAWHSSSIFVNLLNSSMQSPSIKVNIECKYYKTATTAYTHIMVIMSDKTTMLFKTLVQLILCKIFKMTLVYAEYCDPWPTKCFL